MRKLSCVSTIRFKPPPEGVTQPALIPLDGRSAYAVGTPDTLLHYHVWYQGLGEEAASRQRRWRDFLLGDDPHEEVIGRSDWAKAGDDFRRRLYVPEARPARSEGSAPQTSARPGGVFPPIL
jgi:hypothetical protein